MCDSLKVNLWVSFCFDLWPCVLQGPGRLSWEGSGGGGVLVWHMSGWFAQLGKEYREIFVHSNLFQFLVKFHV